MYPAHLPCVLPHGGPAHQPDATLILHHHHHITQPRRATLPIALVWTDVGSDPSKVLLGHALRMLLLVLLGFLLQHSLLGGHVLTMAGFTRSPSLLDSTVRWR